MYIIKLEEKLQNGTVSTIPYNLMHFNFSSPKNLDYNVTNLTPYTTYKWRVAAATVNGTGPYHHNEFQTTEDGKKHIYMIIICISTICMLCQ